MERSLHLNRDKAFHRQRRRVWDNAFKTSLSTFAPQIEHFTDQLLTRLRHEEGQFVPLLVYTTYYSYDVMAALAFGKPMGFIKGEQSEVAASILATFTNSVQALGYMYHMPWLMNAIGVLTSFAGPMKEWRDWSVSQMRARMKVHTPNSPPHSLHLQPTQLTRSPIGPRLKTRPNLAPHRLDPQNTRRPGPPLRRIASHNLRGQRNNLHSPNIHLHAPRHAPPLHVRRARGIPRPPPDLQLPTPLTLPRSRNPRINAHVAFRLLRLAARDSTPGYGHQRPFCAR